MLEWKSVLEDNVYTGFILSIRTILTQKSELYLFTLSCDIFFLKGKCCGLSHCHFLNDNYLSARSCHFLHDLMAGIEMPPLKSRDSSGGRVSAPGQQLHLTTQSLNGNEISSTSSSDKKYSCRHYAAKVLQNMNFLRQSTRFCDVEIVAGGRIMKVRSSNISKLAFLVIFYILYCCVTGYICLNFCVRDCCHPLRIYLTLRLLNPIFHC